MRVISQDGNIDYNYDNVIIELGISADDNYKILCMAGDRMPTSIAKYSTEKQAKQAMEMLRNTYKNNQYFLNIASGTFIERQEAVEKATQTEVEDIERLYFTAVDSCVFQFPEDKGLEE